MANLVFSTTDKLSTSERLAYEDMLVNLAIQISPQYAEAKEQLRSKLQTELHAFYENNKTTFGMLMDMQQRRITCIVSLIPHEENMLRVAQLAVTSPEEYVTTGKTLIEAIKMRFPEKILFAKIHKQNPMGINMIQQCGGKESNSFQEVDSERSEKDGWLTFSL